jgi:long-chain fatty acid transport protein
VAPLSEKEILMKLESFRIGVRRRQIHSGFSRGVRIAAVAAVFAITPASGAIAGGLYFPVTGSAGDGAAGAGVGARGTEASTAFWNPAAMTKLADHAFEGALAPGFGNVEFDPDDNTPAGGGDGGDQGGLIPVLSSAYVHKLSDRIRLGIALNSISGASLDPSNSWAGRNQMTELSLFTLSAAPTAAIRITDKFSVGAGALLTYARLDWDLRVSAAIAPNEPKVSIEEADDFAAAPIVGIFYEPTDDLRFGLHYLGESDLELDGDVDISTPMGVSASFDLDLPLAQRVSAHMAWDATVELTVLVSAWWEDWSTLETTGVAINGNSQTVPLEMRDTWGGALGFEFHATDRWTFQSGVSYDSSALKNSDRTAALPIDRTIRLSAGMLHDYTEHTQLGFSFNYLNLGKAKLDQPTVTGSYDDNQLFVFAFNVNWSKLPWSGRAQF